MNKPSVLVVEDEALIAFDIAESLSEFGWDIVGPVGTIDEALALAASEQIDVALMDVNLGGRKSYPVAEKLAERGIPVLYLTGDQAADAPAGGSGLQILSKPVDYQTLHDTLTNQINTG